VRLCAGESSDTSPALSDASGATAASQDIGEGQDTTSGHKHLLLQEVTVAGLDRPMRLTTLSASVCDVGLNVREAHVFSTNTGYLLDIFVTDPLPGVDAEHLEDVRAHTPTISLSFSLVHCPHFLHVSPLCAICPRARCASG
jgi:hypothetical protein